MALLSLARRIFPLSRLGLLRGFLAGCALFLILFFATALWRARLISPSPTLLLEDRYGRFLGEAAAGGGQNGESGYWPLAAPPPRVVAATLALEDRRFWWHPGVDPISVLRAAVQNLRHRRRVSGASSIAMQVARLQHPGARNYWNKAVEALTAFILTHRYGREAILAQYLRLVPYGNRIHGIAYAARRYLDKPVEDLSWAEIAYLSALPRAPGRMNPFSPAGRLAAAARGRRILRRLYRQKVLTREEYGLARTQIAEIRIPEPGERPACALHAILRLDRDLSSPAARKPYLSRPIVRTTLDLDLQREVARMTRDAVHRWADLGAANAAVIVVDRPTGEIRAWVGSSDYFDASRSGAIDYTDIPRSAGSTLKPFLYALALERGVITPATMLDDLERGAGGITNADDLFLGPLLPRVALANSRNVPAANLLARVGLDEGFDFFRELGLHDGAKPARRYGLGLAIGGLPVTLERLVRAYTVLADGGRLEEPAWLRGADRPAAPRLLSEETAREVTLFLSDPMARLPSFPRMGSTEFPFPVAVKTGTSSNYRDAWTVAYSTRALVGVWVGHPDFRPMNHVTGYRCAAALMHEVMTRLHRDQMEGLEDIAFPPPAAYRPVRVCALSGERATAACEKVFLEWFAPGQEPAEECAMHVRVAVDARTGEAATRSTPKSAIEMRTFALLPPRYAAWAAAAGVARVEPAPGLPPSPSSPGVARIRITSPQAGARLLRDPETPPEMSTLELSAVVDPPCKQLVWYIDGKPYVVADYPRPVRWPLRPGSHTFEARLPFGKTASAPVRVRIE